MNMENSSAFISMINKVKTKKQRISKIDFIKQQQKPIEQLKENKKLKFIQGSSK